MVDVSEHRVRSRCRGYKHKRTKKKRGGGFGFLTRRHPENNVSNIDEPKDPQLPESIQNLTFTGLSQLYPEGIPLSLFSLDKSQIGTIIQRQKNMDENKQKESDVPFR